jgi:hypothetical protein
MQMPLSFVQERSNESEPSQNVWTTLDAKQRNEALVLLARLLAKTSTAHIATASAKKRKERRDD